MSDRTEKKEFVLILGGLILSIILFVACSKCSYYVIGNPSNFENIEVEYKFVCWSGGVSILSAFVFLASLNTIGYNNFKLMKQFFMLLFLFLGASLGMVYRWRKEVLGIKDESDNTKQDEILKALLFMGSISALSAFSIMALEYNRSILPIELKQSSQTT